MTPDCGLIGGLRGANNGLADTIGLFPQQLERTSDFVGHRSGGGPR
jgi:hypothetical protein